MKWYELEKLEKQNLQSWDNLEANLEERQLAHSVLMAFVRELRLKAYDGWFLAHFFIHRLDLQRGKSMIIMIVNPTMSEIMVHGLLRGKNFSNRHYHFRISPITLTSELEALFEIIMGQPLSQD